MSLRAVRRQDPSEAGVAAQTRTQRRTSERTPEAVADRRTAGLDLLAVRDRLDLPLVVKPIADGSSIGVSWVEEWSQLEPAVAHAAASGGGVLVERAVIGREIDVGVLETADGVLHVSPTLEITTSHGERLFDFHAKYDDPDTRFDIPAALDRPTVIRLEQSARTMFTALGCAGLLRVDFFLRDDGELVLNEVNTMPGFTTASQYPQMWQRAGVDYARLLDLLIESALARGAGTRR